MVYCGKPSKGCQACRDRKTRCDRQTPSCSQCIRGQRVCPGYRNELDLMFRNESDSVVVKANIKKKRKEKASPPQPSASSSASSSSSAPKDLRSDEREIKIEDEVTDFNEFWVDDKRSVIPAGLSPTIRDRALSFFNNKKAIWLRNYDIVESMSSQTNTDEHLIASLHAVGLASYAASVREPKLMIQARKDYVKAIQLTNSALRSPTDVKKDSTLFSVMALGSFETVAGSGENSLVAWEQHLHGAAELVKIRGGEQFRSPAGQRMFAQVTSNLMVDCMRKGRPLPPHILGMREATRPFMDPRDPGIRMADVIVAFTMLRASIIARKLTDPRMIVGAALGLDRKFADIAESLPPTWKPRVVYNHECPDMIWNGMYHLYPNFWASQMLNTLRTIRLHIQEVIRDQLEVFDPATKQPVFSDDESEQLFAESFAKMIEIQGEILATIPQHAPWNHPSSPSSPSGKQDIGEARAYFILWPLFLVGVMDITSDEKRAWVINRFRSIGKMANIEHATRLAECIEKRQREVIWDAKKKGVHKPQKLDPYDWNMEGWAIAHGVILTAQINRPDGANV